MKLCVLCESNSTLYGIQHDNGNGVCLQCVTQIKEAHIKVTEFPFEPMEVVK